MQAGSPPNSAPPKPSWLSKKRAFIVLRTFGVVCALSFLTVSYDNSLVKNLSSNNSFSNNDVSRNLTASSANHSRLGQAPSSSLLQQQQQQQQQEDLLRTATELLQKMKNLSAKEAALKEEKEKNLQAEMRKRLEATTPNHDYIAGCVMVMDSNHELIEWLAYNYHVLPLRRLIILNDAKSKTTPQPIVQRWKGLIDITIWTENDIWPEGPPKSGADTGEGNYIKRQFTFNKHCMRQLYQEGHRWIQLHDPDEYLTINGRVYDKKEPMYGLNVSSQAIDIPSPREAGSVLKFVNNVIEYVHKFGIQNSKFLQIFETPCIPVHRKQYSSREDNGKGTPVEKPPFPLGKRQGIEPADLSTWRWQRFGGRKPIVGKALLDFDRIRMDELPKESNVHVPISPKKGICRQDLIWRGEKHNPLVMNHYASTLEQALFRSADSRGGIESRKERFEKDKELYGKFKELRTHLLEWLPGFVDSFGKTEAARLLQHAGNPQMANVDAYLDATTAHKDDNSAEDSVDSTLKEDKSNKKPQSEETDDGPKLGQPAEQDMGLPFTISTPSSTAEALQNITTELAQQIKEIERREESLVDEHQDFTSNIRPLKRKDDSLEEQVGEAKNSTLLSIAKHNYVSGCVMVKDNNHDLIEWLAYHYFTLPLRRLIIFNDVNARTTPDPIVQRWRNLINITVWNEKDVWPEGPHATGKDVDYSQRQREFNAQCMQTLYAEGQRWIQLHDTNEYMTINDRVYNKSDPMFGLNLTSRKLSVPSPGEGGSMLKLVKRAIQYVHRFGVQSNQYLEPFETPCIAFKRKQFSNLEDTSGPTGTPEEKTVQPKLPLPFPFDKSTGIEPADLSTWRWHHWGGRGGGMGKTLIDFARIDSQDIPENPSVHNPISHADICRRDLSWRGERDMPLVINSYAPSWEKTLFQAGDRQGVEQSTIDRYNSHKKFTKMHEKKPHILEWLTGFVEEVGSAEAMRLLQYAGNPSAANTGAFLDRSQNQEQTPKTKRY